MINNFPLSWPEGWPRASLRKSATFARRGYSDSAYRPLKNLEVADGVGRVLLELSRLGVDRQDIIISTNVRTRIDGLPRSGEAEPKDPGAAVYWQDDKRRSRVMAIDRYDRVADNLAAIAATLEALRAIERHGGGQILERAFTGFTALPSPGVARPWWAVLGIDPQADRAEIELAYKRRRSATHADKGGSDAEFHEVQQAYELALAQVRP